MSLYLPYKQLALFPDKNAKGEIVVCPLLQAIKMPVLNQCIHYQRSLNRNDIKYKCSRIYTHTSPNHTKNFLILVLFKHFLYPFQAIKKKSKMLKAFYSRKKNSFSSSIFLIDSFYTLVNLSSLCMYRVAVLTHL